MFKLCASCILCRSKLCTQLFRIAATVKKRIAVSSLSKGRVSRLQTFRQCISIPFTTDTLTAQLLYSDWRAQSSGRRTPFNRGGCGFFFFLGGGRGGERGGGTNSRSYAPLCSSLPPLSFCTCLNPLSPCPPPPFLRSSENLLCGWLRSSIDGAWRQGAIGLRLCVRAVFLAALPCTAQHFIVVDSVPVDTDACFLQLVTSVHITVLCVGS